MNRSKNRTTTPGTLPGSAPAPRKVLRVPAGYGTHHTAH